MRLAHANETRGTPTKRQVVIGPLSLGIESLDGEPVDRDGVVGSAQRHGVEPAVNGGGALATFADGLAMFLEFGAMQVFRDGLMRRWLAGEDEIAAGVKIGRGGSVGSG